MRHCRGEACLSIEAYFRSLSGEKVGTIERKDHIGGAWSIIDSEDFLDVEYGTHIFFPPTDSVHNFMRDYLDWDLISMEPVPEIVVAGRKFSLAPHNEILAKNLKYWSIFRSGEGMKKISKGVIAFWYDRNFRPLRSFVRGMVKFMKMPKEYPQYLYINGGSPVMLDLFRKQIAEAGVEIMLDMKLEQIDVRQSEERVLLKTNDGRIEAKQLVLTTCSATQDFQIDGKSLPMPNQERCVNHLHLYLLNKKERRFSYLVFEGHPFLRRVSDVTRFAQPLTDDPDKQVICVWLRTRIDLDRTEKGASEVMDELIRLGYFPSDTTIDSFDWSRYGGTFQEDKTLELISHKAGPLVKTLSSENLVMSMLPHIVRWKLLKENADNAEKREALAR